MNPQIEEQFDKPTIDQLIEIYNCEWDNVHGDIVLFV